MLTVNNLSLQVKIGGQAAWARQSVSARVSWRRLSGARKPVPGAICEKQFLLRLGYEQAMGLKAPA